MKSPFTVPQCEIFPHVAFTLCFPFTVSSVNFLFIIFHSQVHYPHKEVWSGCIRLLCNYFKKIIKVLLQTLCEYSGYCSWLMFCFSTDLFVCVEVDSYGHYFRKAKSKLVCNSANPRWNEQFIIELEGSQNLRILLYEESQDRAILRAKSTQKVK